MCSQKINNCAVQKGPKNRTKFVRYSRDCYNRGFSVVVYCEVFCFVKKSTTCRCLRYSALLTNAGGKNRTCFRLVQTTNVWCVWDGTFILMWEFVEFAKDRNFPHHLHIASNCFDTGNFWYLSIWSFSSQIYKMQLVEYFSCNS